MPHVCTIILLVSILYQGGIRLMISHVSNQSSNDLVYSGNARVCPIADARDRSNPPVQLQHEGENVQYSPDRIFWRTEIERVWRYLRLTAAG